MKKMRIFFAGGIALIVAIGLFWAISPNPKEESVIKHGTLVIEDVDLASWMTINNSFNFGTPYWEGVLIQVGDYLKEDGASFGIFDRIEIRDKHGALFQRSRGEFRWINIVAVDQGLGVPMEPEHLSLFFPVLDPDEVYDCGDFDRCARLNCGTPEPGLPLFAPCLRQQSLHGFFSPVGIITYWHGRDGFDVSVKLIGAADHGTHTFSFNDPVQIFVDGELLELGKVDSIHIKAIPEPHHGGKHDPGW